MSWDYDGYSCCFLTISISFRSNTILGCVNSRSCIMIVNNDMMEKNSCDNLRKNLKTTIEGIILALQSRFCKRLTVFTRF